MRHATARQALVATLTLALVAATGCERQVGGTAAAAAPATVQRWEYAQLVWSVDGSRFASPDEDVKSAPSSMEAGTSPGQLYTKLAGHGGGDQGLFSTLNLIGAKGWRLVQIEKTGADTMYLFERPALAR